MLLEFAYCLRILGFGKNLNETFHRVFFFLIFQSGCHMNTRHNLQVFILCMTHYVY